MFVHQVDVSNGGSLNELPFVEKIDQPHPPCDGLDPGHIFHDFVACTFERIKWKMGTSELTTAELTLNGALAYPVGPLERGLANLVGIVLTYSRLTVGLPGAASMMRAWREAARDCDFREAFGFPIGRRPMVAGQLATIEKAAKRTLAGAFRLYADALSLPDDLAGAPDAQDADDVKQRRFDSRELIMLQKMATSFDAPMSCVWP